MAKHLPVFICFLFLPNLFYSQRIISGSVTDQSGEALVGVNITAAENQSIGTATDGEGNYTLEIPDGVSTLVFSYMGFATQEAAIGASDVIDVEMAEGVLMQEIVVTGYGEQKRADVSGAIAKIAGADLQGKTVSGIDGALQGQVPGLLLTTNTGQPGAAMTMRIRGSSSINAGNAPLYVIDGIPVTTGNFSEGTYGGLAHNVLSDLSPFDIESIEVLKDAASASIYGSRASNGVVLISTKRGAESKSQISFGYSRGAQSDIKRWELLSGEQYAELTGTSWNGKNADFESAVYRTAPVSQYDLSIAGGDLKTKYYLGGSYFDQKGVLINQGFDRLSGRFNFDHHATDWLKLSAGISMVKSNTNIVPSDDNIFGVLPILIVQPRNVDIYAPDGSFSLDGYFFENPVGAAVEKTNIITTRRTLANIGARLQLLENLAFQSKVGLDVSDFKERNYYPATTFQGAGKNGEAFLNTTLASRTVYQNYLDYQTAFNLFKVGVMAGVDYELFSADNTSLAGNGFPSSDFRFLASAAEFTDASQDVTDSRLLSYYARANIGYKEKYVVTATFRADGSSKFGENNRYGYFPSISLGWRAHQEEFFSKMAALDNLKLRVSYGFTGNQEGIGNFAARGLSLGGNNYQGQPGVAPATLANPNLKWEATAEFNIGLDYGLWNDRLHGTFDFYIKNTNDLLVVRPLPPNSGFTGIDQNVGKMRNSGFEFWANGLLVDKPLRWELGFQVAAYTNEVVDLYDGQGFNPDNFLMSRVDEGQPISYFYGLKSLGVNPETGDLDFEDVNGDGKINDSDYQFIGSPHPDFFGSVKTSVSYKNFYLDAFVNFVQGNEIANFTRVFNEDGLTRGFNNNTRVLDAWKQPGDVTDVYRIGGPNAALNSTTSSSHWVEDGSFVRLKTVTLGYHFPQAVLRRFGMSQLNIYLAGENLLTWTDYLGLDPEVNHSGGERLIAATDFFTQGLNRTVKVGISGRF